MSEKTTSKKFGTDLERLREQRDEEIDFSDIPSISPERFAQAIVREGLEQPSRKRQVTLRLDEDVLEWFRAQGRGYQTRINALLREYMKAHRK